MTTSTVKDRFRARVTAVENRYQQPRRSRTAWLVLALMGAAALLVLSPFALVLLNTFKSATDYAQFGPLTLPRSFDFTNITVYIERVNFWQKLLNSVLMSGLIATGAVILSVFSAFALGIGRVKGRTAILAIVLVANILPQEALIYPLFAGVQALNFTNALVPVIGILIVMYSTFGTYFVASVMSTYPTALLEAAQIDGAGKMRMLFSVVVPVIRPTLLVLFVFVFVWSWNDYFIPITFLTDTSQQTVPIALASLQGQRFLDPTTTAAASLISLIPTFIFFLIFQRTLVRGVSVGAVK